MMVTNVGLTNPAIDVLMPLVLNMFRVKFRRLCGYYVSIYVTLMSNVPFVKLIRKVQIRSSLHEAIAEIRKVGTVARISTLMKMRPLLTWLVRTLVGSC